MSPTDRIPQGQLPGSIEPILLAEQGAHLAGTLPIKAMPRLVEAGLDGDDMAQVDLRFGRAEFGDAQGGTSPGARGSAVAPRGSVYEMTGRVSATVHTACQRCLEPMALTLEAEVRLLLLRAGERADGLAPEVEALVVDRPLRLSALVEDELLLVLPMIPMHPAEACPAKKFVKPATSAGKPLSGLSRLKRT
jgi:uncharacterized protein